MSLSDILWIGCLASIEGPTLRTTVLFSLRVIAAAVSEHISIHLVSTSLVLGPFEAHVVCSLDPPMASV